MRSPALFTVIVVGVGSVASAEPKQNETSGRVSYTENADSANPDEPRRPGEWVELASATPSKHGTEYVMVGREAGTFSQVRIEAVKGRTEVQVVKIVFDDGTAKRVRVEKRISTKRDRSTVIELKEPKVIDHIEVTVDSGLGGHYAVYGSSSGGSVATR